MTVGIISYPGIAADPPHHTDHEQSDSASKESRYDGDHDYAGQGQFGDFLLSRKPSVSYVLFQSHARRLSQAQLEPGSIERIGKARRIGVQTQQCEHMAGG